MRRSTTCAGRVLTIFSLVTILLSFAVFVDASPASSPYALVLKRADPPDTNATTNAQPNADNGGVHQSPPPTTTTSTSSSSSLTSTTSIVTTSTSTSTSSTPTTSTTSAQTSTSSSTSSTTPTSTSTTSSSTITSTSSTLTTATTTNTTSTRGTTLLVSGIPSTLSNNGGSTLIATNIGQFTSSPTAVDPIETIDANSSGSASSGSSKSFLKNTGAMAATFAIVGIVALAALTAAIMVWRKKRRSEERDIFESEYHDYNANASFKTNNDMSALGDGASISGYSQHIDTGYNVAPPANGLASNRSSTVSNHAGYGAFKKNQAQPTAAQPPSAMRQQSSLRNEVQLPSKTLYQEPAVDENQSIYLMPHAASQDQRYSADSFYSKVTNAVGTAQ